MAEKMTLDDKVDQMLIDLASVKTDVAWLKKLFMGMVIPVFVTIAVTFEAVGVPI